MCAHKSDTKTKKYGRERVELTVRRPMDVALYMNMYNVLVDSHARKREQEQGKISCGFIHHLAHTHTLNDGQSYLRGEFRKRLSMVSNTLHQCHCNAGITVKPSSYLISQRRVFIGSIFLLFLSIRSRFMVIEVSL